MVKKDKMAQEMLSKIGEVYGTAKNSRMASDKKSEKGFFGKLFSWKKMIISIDLNLVKCLKPFIILPIKILLSWKMMSLRRITYAFAKFVKV